MEQEPRNQQELLIQQLNIHMPEELLTEIAGGRKPSRGDLDTVNLVREKY